MFKRITTLVFTLTFFTVLVIGQSTKTPEFTVQQTTAKRLGHSKAITDLVAKQLTSKEKKAKFKKDRKVPDNFKGRRGQSMATNKTLEHQGTDPVLQLGFPKLKRKANEPLINIDGINDNLGSPQDPSGDVSDKFYVQAINVTEVGVFDLDGNLLQEFSMNTLWSQFGVRSEGDPIILYDENEKKWIVTEFTGPANILIAISDSDDPLGGYTAYNYSTPSFPDYPKYGLTPDALVVTTNEEGVGRLHQYFIDIKGLYAGEDNVPMQRIEVVGNNDTEAGFYITTPTDWNGSRLPYDNRPITLAINDSSWAGGPDQDQIEIYTFDIDFEDQNNSTVSQTSVVISPFDSYPCSSSNGGLFACVPQLGGGGLDAIPEVIMNVPHLRNFGSHESMVFNFITDATDGQNRSGIRWVEFRRTSSDSEWELYQEGTFAPDDGLNRYMGSIAINERGEIGLGYNVSSTDSYVGVRYTGRSASDPLGMMTLEEVVAIEGSGVIRSGSRFGDYSQISVAPESKGTFWFVTEYAGNSNPSSKTRIVAFEISTDSFDLSAQSIVNPQTNSSSLTDSELVTAEILNSGIFDMFDFEVGLILEGDVVEVITVTDTLSESETTRVNFTRHVDMTEIKDYNIGIFVSKDTDQNLFNDTLYSVISKIPLLEVGVEASIDSSDCKEKVLSKITLNNFGESDITEALISVNINGILVDTIEYTGSLLFEQSEVINYDVTGLIEGNNEITFTIIDINGSGLDLDETNNFITVNTKLLPPNSFFTFVFLTDEYPEESTWQLTLEGETGVIDEGGFDEVSSEYRIDICADLSACYTITIFDEAGDGICCNFGQGNFSIENSFGETLAANNGNFGVITSETFCPGERNCIIEADIVVENASSAGEADGSILLSASNGVAPYTYSIDGGVSFQEEPLFDGLVADTYSIVIVDADSICTYTEEVVVSNLVGVYDINGTSVSINILPNPTDGVFKVNIENLNIPDHLLTIQVYDLNGRLIQNRGIGKFNNIYTGTFSLYDYSDGIYFVKISHPHFSLLEKVVKY